MSLLERFANGDLDAFEDLFRQYQARIYAWIMRIVRDTGVAEDLTVETFWRIYRTRADFDASADFGAWAYRIATNLALSHIRRRPRDQELDEASVVRESPNPALQRETRKQIQRAFHKLPAKLQVAVTMALIEEQPYQDIAQALGVPGGYGEIKSVSGGAQSAPEFEPDGSHGRIAMKEPDHEEVSAVLREVFPRVDTELRRDLWPAMLRKLDAAPVATPWYDWALAGCLAGAVLFSRSFCCLLLITYRRGIYESASLSACLYGGNCCAHGISSGRAGGVLPGAVCVPRARAD